MSAASTRDAFREDANTAFTAIPTGARTSRALLLASPSLPDKSMLTDFYHKTISMAEWGWPAGVIASVFAATPKMLAQATPPMTPDLTGSQWTVIAMGVSMITAKIIEMSMSAYKQYRQINDQSDHGKLAACIADRAAQKESYESEIVRYKQRIETIIADYELRLKSKRDETDYLRATLASSRESEKQLRMANEAMTATLVQQGEILARLAHRSVDNTSEAIKKIAPTPVAAVVAVEQPCPPVGSHDDIRVTP